MINVLTNSVITLWTQKFRTLFFFSNKSLGRYAMSVHHEGDKRPRRSTGCNEISEPMGSQGSWVGAASISALLDPSWA